MATRPWSSQSRGTVKTRIAAAQKRRDSITTSSSRWTTKFCSLSFRASPSGLNRGDHEDASGGQTSFFATCQEASRWPEPGGGRERK